MWVTTYSVYLDPSAALCLVSIVVNLQRLNHKVTNTQRMTLKCDRVLLFA